MHGANNTLACSVVLLAAAALAFGGDQQHRKGPRVKVDSPLSPAESLKYLEVAPGLRAELVATEPEVIDPVAMAFDEDGRMWVVEMSDYPNGPVEGGPPKSRVRVLEDRDGDGRFESSRTFVDQLLFATGLQLWKGGVFVTLAGKVMYFRDTTGDGRADVKQTWYTGFAEKNEQLRANHPTLGPDGRIYIANGLRGGTVVGRRDVDGRNPEPVSISGMDFRFEPHTGRYEAVSGMGQFGLAFDDFGNRFVCSNRNAAKHIVLKHRYIKRNPLLALPSAAHDVCPPGEAAKVFPLSRNWTHYSSDLGQITSACAVFVYRGDAMAEPYVGNLFVCEPAGNLVHRRLLSRRGATFSSRRAREAVEFLASPDDWFRPVNLTIGPDGAMYVVDMYRAVVEHPHWLPEDLVRKLPLNAGDDRGRIYRLVASGHRAPHQRPRLSTASRDELIRALDHPSAWWRETAARLIYERQDKGVRPALEAMVGDGSRPVSRIHALWSLDGLGALSEQVVRAALEDLQPEVVEQAVRFSERWLAGSPAIQRRVVSLSGHADPRVRFQVALSLGEVERSDEMIDALKRIALHEAADSWARHAVLSSLHGDAGRLLDRLLADVRSGRAVAGPTVTQLSRELAEVVGARRDERQITRVLARVVAVGTQAGGPWESQAPSDLQFAILDGLGRGLVRGDGSLARLVSQLGEEEKDTRDGIERLFSGAAVVAARGRVPISVRRRCLELLRHAGFAVAGDTLIRLARSEPSQDLRLLAIGILGGYEHPGVGRVLLGGFRSQTPPVRRAVLDAMLGAPGRVRLLLAEFSAGRISVSELSPTTVQRLLEHPDEGLRGEAKRLLAAAVPASRQQVLSEYGAALSLAGDMSRGRLVFEKSCAVCHRVGGLGFEVGPYIGDFHLRKKPAVLLESILNPNRAIDANYVSYTVVTDAGRVHTGIIAQETASSITLKRGKNQTETILRQQIDEIRSNGVSLMPEGLEKDISVEQMADLIAYLRGWRFLADLVPLEE